MLENNQNQNLVLIKDLGMLFPKESSSKKVRYGIYKYFCGNEFKTTFSNVKNGGTKSCGCYQSKRVSETNKKTKITHSYSSHRLYKTWQGMMARCYNNLAPNYKYYGQNGITVCDRWHDVKNFIEDMYPTFIEGLTLDRENSNGNYEPSNCRWATQKTQSINKRCLRSDNTTGYKGVMVSGTKYITRIFTNNKRKQLGTFSNKVDAAKAYDQYVIDNNLEYTLNFNSEEVN